MKRYRMRPQDVYAIQFDGTSAGVERVVAWMAVVAPRVLIRPRTEYRGWDDLTGYLELEIKGMDDGCMASDWIVVTEVEGNLRTWLVDESTFAKYYEESPPEAEARDLPFTDRTPRGIR